MSSSNETAPSGQPALKHRQAMRLYDSLRAAVGEALADELLAQLPLSAAPSDKRAADWACRSCALLQARLGDEQANAVRRGCHCKPSPAHVKALRAQWVDSASPADFVARAGGDGLISLDADGASLLLTYPECYCPFVKRLSAPLPALWCACSVGYAEDMFRQITGGEARAELLESVLAGAACCRIRVTLG